MNSIARNILLLLVLLTACGGEEKALVIPSDIIPQEVFSEIMADVTLIEAVKNLNVSKEMKDVDSFSAYYAGVWEKYGVDEATFIRSFNYYKDHPSVMKEIYKKSAERLKEYEKEVEKNKELRKQTATDELSGDSLQSRTGENLPKTAVSK